MDEWMDGLIETSLWALGFGGARGFVQMQMGLCSASESSGGTLTVQL